MGRASLALSVLHWWAPDQVKHRNVSLSAKITPRIFHDTMVCCILPNFGKLSSLYHCSICHRFCVLTSIVCMVVTYVYTYSSTYTGSLCTYLCKRISAICAYYLHSSSILLYTVYSTYILKYVCILYNLEV